MVCFLGKFWLSLSMIVSRNSQLPKAVLELDLRLNLSLNRRSVSSNLPLSPWLSPPLQTK